MLEELNMSKNTIIALLVIGVFVLVGCGAEDVEKADSIEDIVGTWQRVGGSIEYIQRYFADGTYYGVYGGGSLDQLNERIGGNAGEYWFEDTQYFESHGWPTPGVYEILLLESGNIKYELIEDVCSGCAGLAVGSGSTEGEIEWEPVP